MVLALWKHTTNWAGELQAPLYSLPADLLQPAEGKHHMSITGLAQPTIPRQQFTVTMCCWTMVQHRSVINLINSVPLWCDRNNLMHHFGPESGACPSYILPSLKKNEAKWQCSWVTVSSPVTWKKAINKKENPWKIFLSQSIGLHAAIY